MWLTLSIVLNCLLLVASGYAGYRAWHTKCRMRNERMQHGMQHALTLRALAHMTDILEQVAYAADSHMADNETRRVLAGEISGARAYVVSQVGPNPIVDNSYLVGSTWPFDKAGKVKP